MYAINHLSYQLHAPLGFLYTIIASHASTNAHLMQKMNSMQMWRAGCTLSVGLYIARCCLFIDLNHTHLL